MTREGPRFALLFGKKLRFLKVKERKGALRHARKRRLFSGSALFFFKMLPPFVSGQCCQIILRLDK